MKYKQELIIGAGVFVVLVVIATQLYASDYRNILNAYPNAQLILLPYVSEDKIELLGRDTSGNVEFIRWKYEGAKIKTYFGSRLKDTSYVQIFEGTRGIWFNEKKPVRYYVFENNTAYIIFETDYYYDSRHTNYAGKLIQTIIVYPQLNKMTFEWIPKDENRKYILRWIHEAKAKKSENLLGKCFWKQDDYTIDWCDSKDKVSWSRSYKTSGRVVIAYKSKKGYQKIDPTIYLFGKIKAKKTSVDHSLTYFRLRFNLTLTTNYTIGHPSQFNTVYKRISGKHNLSKLEFRIKKTTTKTKSYICNTEYEIIGNYFRCIDEYSRWNNNTQKWENGTYVVFEHNFENTIGNTFYWKETVSSYVPFNPVGKKVIANKTYELELYAKKRAELGKTAIHFDTFVGGESLNMTWWNESWKNVNPVRIWTSSGFTGTNYQVLINVTHISGMQTDFDDIRFTLDDNSTELYYWMDTDNCYSSNYCEFWVNLSTANITTSDTIIWMWYNNTDVDNKSNGINTFLFYDDFTDYTTNNISEHGRWFVVTGSGYTIDTTNDVMKYSNSSSNSIKSKNFAEDSSKLHIKSKVRWTGGLSDWIDNFMCSGSCLTPYQGAGIGDYSNILRSRTSTSSSDTSFFPSQGTWYILQAYINSTTTKAYADSTQVTSTGSNWNNQTRLWLRFYGRFGNSATGEMDWIRIRKYVYPEPHVLIRQATNSLYLNGLPKDMKYEIGKTALMMANSTDPNDYVCINISDMPGYGNCSYGMVTYNWTTFAREWRFNDSTVSKTLSENDTVYIGIGTRINLESAQLNITGIDKNGFPEDIKIDVCNDGTIDAELPGKINGTYGEITKTNEGKTNDSIDFPVSGYQFKYITFSRNGNMTGATINLTGTVSNVTVNTLNDSNSAANYSYVDGVYSRTFGIDVAKDSTISKAQWVLTGFPLQDSLNFSENFTTTTYKSGSTTANWNTTTGTLKLTPEIDDEVTYSEGTANHCMSGCSCSYINTMTDDYNAFDSDVWSEDFMYSYIYKGACSLGSGQAETVSYRDYIFNNASAGSSYDVNMRKFGAASGCQAWDPAGMSVWKVYVYNYTSSSWREIYSSVCSASLCPSTRVNVAGTFSSDEVSGTEAKIRTYTETDATEIACVSRATYLWIRNIVNDGKNVTDYYPDKTQYGYSTEIDNSLRNFYNATLDANTTTNGQTVNYYLSANGGSDWESVSNGTLHRFSNLGTQIMWRVDMSTNNREVTPIIYEINVSTPIYYPANVTVDTGADGIIEYENTTIYNTSATIDLNMSYIQNYVDNTCWTTTCTIPIQVNSTSIGALEISGIDVEYYSTPEDVTLDIGNDGHIDWNQSGSFMTSEIVNLNTTAIQNYVDGSECNSILCDVPLLFSSTKAGKVNMSDIVINYTYNPIALNKTAIVNCLNLSENKTNVSIGINASVWGNVIISDIQIDYKGKQEYDITVFGTKSDFGDSHVLTVLWSNFSLVLPYNFTDDLIWIASSVDYNVTPHGQTQTIPIFNITGLGYDMPFNLSIYVNESLDSCISLIASNDSTRDGNDIKINTIPQEIYHDIQYNDNFGVWLFVDVNNCSSRWEDFYIKEQSCCKECVPCY